MTKRLLFTTAVGLILSTAAFAQTSTEPAKSNQPNSHVAQQNDKAAKPQSRVEKWQADKKTEAAEQNIDKNTGSAPASSSNSAQNSQSQSGSSQPAANTAQSTPASSGSSQNQQSQAPAPTANNNANGAPNSQPKAAAQTQPNAGAPNAPSTQQTKSNTPANQPAGLQAQTPNAATSTNQQAQQPQNNTNTAASSQTSISAGVHITDPQRTRIGEAVARVNAKPLTKVNFSVSIGTAVPRDVRLYPVPVEVVQIVPQYRDYRFFTVRDEIVIVEPSTMKIVTILPRGGSTTASTTTTTTKQKISASDRAAIKKQASKSHHERSTRIERDDARSARAESQARLRIGDRIPTSVELYDMPEPVYRDAPTLREYRYMSRGSRTYVIEPRERTIIEEID